MFRSAFQCLLIQWKNVLTISCQQNQYIMEDWSVLLVPHKMFHFNSCKCWMTNLGRKLLSIRHKNSSFWRLTLELIVVRKFQANNSETYFIYSLIYSQYRKNSKCYPALSQRQPQFQTTCSFCMFWEVTNWSLLRWSLSMSWYRQKIIIC